MKENFVNQDKTEKGLIIPETEGIFTKFFKWVRKIFVKEEKQVVENTAPVNSNIQTYTIPKEVKIPIRIENSEDIDENSIEYLYKLSDKEVNDLNTLYNEQMQEAKTEIEKLEKILETYKQSIKRLQGEISENNI